MFPLVAEGLLNGCGSRVQLFSRLSGLQLGSKARQYHSSFSTSGPSPSDSSPARNTHRQQHLANLKVEHAQFLATASPREKWQDPSSSTSLNSEEKELEGVKEGTGKLLPTSSHLFKLILPLNLKLTATTGGGKEEKKGAEVDERVMVPTVLLLHPAQPLMHVAQLIRASLHPSSSSINISFRSNPSRKGNLPQFEWSDSTNVGDFIRDAARATEFTIYIADEDASPGHDSSKHEIMTKRISVRVPSFADRTRFLRRRLETVESQLASMEKLKDECDREAKRGARRMAVGGFGLLVVYWGAVARLTFWDYGWDVMEPITYLSGLSTVICGYLW
jgi:calcium uniporter protein, mitochondrial